MKLPAWMAQVEGKLLQKIAKQCGVVGKKLSNWNFKLLFHGPTLASQMAQWNKLLVHVLDCWPLLQLRNLGPGVNVTFESGYTSPEVLQLGEKNGMKPFWGWGDFAYTPHPGFQSPFFQISHLLPPVLGVLPRVDGFQSPPGLLHLFVANPHKPFLCHCYWVGLGVGFKYVVLYLHLLISRITFTQAQSYPNNGENIT